MNDAGSIDVDAYLERLDDAKRTALGELRQWIREEVPEATECISYGIPTFKLNGMLVSYAAFKNHCSFFPGAVVVDFLEDLDGFKVSKGTIQFQPAKPIPRELVSRIVRARVQSQKRR